MTSFHLNHPGVKRSIPFKLVLSFALFFAIIFVLLYSRFRSGNVQTQNLPAFPGAQGFGATTVGGRFGKILFVTNLNDTLDLNSKDYVGSLRWAVESTWPDDPNSLYDQRRVIIFKIGGTIKLVDDLVIKNPYVTLAGQTAPGGGIALRGFQLTIATHDVIIRDIKVRVGDEGEPTCCRDGINISTTLAVGDVYNIVIDHASVSWAIDENLSTWTDSSKPFVTHDVTVQWSIISEGLNHSIHVDEGASGFDQHSMAMELGQDGYDISIHHNLLAHNWGRNPRISGLINSEVVNNVIYDWGYAALEFSGDKSLTHVLGNYFRATENDTHNAEIYITEKMNPEARIYLAGNVSDDIRVTQKIMSSVRVDNPFGFQLSGGELFVPSGVTVTSALDAFTDVLGQSGAIYPVRDSVDQRIVSDVKNREGNIINSQNDVGGWPDLKTSSYPSDRDNDGIPDFWEITHGLNPFSSNNASNFQDLAPSGYSWIEEYFNSLLSK